MSTNDATYIGAGGVVTSQAEDSPTMELDASWLCRLLQSKQKPSPYFLGSGNSPRTLITHAQLRGDNYNEWMLAVQLALRAKKNSASLMSF